MKYCTFCKPLKMDAVMRSEYRREHPRIQLACEAHTGQIKDGEKSPKRTKHTEQEGSIGEEAQALIEHHYRIKL